MTEQFDIHERLYRAVYPPEIMPMFWKENGEISSAVFKDKRGLSVERAGDRDEDKVINDMHLFFYGTLISIMAGDCFGCNAVLKYLPTKSKYQFKELIKLDSKGETNEFRRNYFN